MFTSMHSTRLAILCLLTTSTGVFHGAIAGSEVAQSNVAQDIVKRTKPNVLTTIDKIMGDTAMASAITGVASSWGAFVTLRNMSRMNGDDSECDILCIDALVSGIMGWVYATPPVSLATLMVSSVVRTRQYLKAKAEFEAGRGAESAMCSE